MSEDYRQVNKSFIENNPVLLKTQRLQWLFRSGYKQCTYNEWQMYIFKNYTKIYINDGEWKKCLLAQKECSWVHVFCLRQLITQFTKSLKNPHILSLTVWPGCNQNTRMWFRTNNPLRDISLSWTPSGDLAWQKHIFTTMQ